MLDNEDMDPSELDGIKDDVDYYIEVSFFSNRAVFRSMVFDVMSPVDLSDIFY